MKTIAKFLILSPNPNLRVQTRFTYLLEKMVLKKILTFLLSLKVMTDTNKNLNNTHII